MTDATDLLSLSYSHYLARAAAARPALAERIAAWAAAPVTRAALDARLDELLAQSGPPPSEDALKKALRQLRGEVFGALAERDLSGRADVAEVTGTMTDLAEAAIQRAVALLAAELEAQYGEPRGPSGERLALGVVGMGKLGGRELNVSSDVDLIFVYEDDGETAGGARAPISVHEFFTRLGRRLIGVLSEATADGYVFRVDMRLRPNGDSGPLVCSLGMLEEYFYVQGREWERYAWIKGRLVTECESAAARRLAQQLDAIVKPFVYRRYLDFGVIGAIRSLHEQIRQEARRRATMRPDKADDIKLGRGGIREIEFSAQVFQLIRGGQDAGFRVQPTLAVLRHASASGLIAEEVRAGLTDAYLFLRTLEHRLQYRNDAQTHAMPVDPAERAALAASLGFADYAALIAQLDRHRAFAEAQFDQVFADKAGGGARREDEQAAGCIWSSALADDGADDALVGRLAELGFADPAAVLARLQAVWRSSRYAGLPESSRVRFDRVAHRALEAAPGIDAAHRDETVVRCFELLETVGRRGAYLALLTEYPAALRRVLSVLGATRWGGDYLIRHPQLLDELLDDEAIDSPFDWPAFKDALRRRLAAADGAEHQMDLLRHAHQAEVFRILLLDLAGRLSVEHVSDRLSELADAMLDVTIEVVWSQLAKRHRDTPCFAAIAYGKLGGKELGYASDLDLIFLYDDPDERAADVYTTFARRLITWLTTATGAGTLFDIDLRLRPNGEAGLLVTDLDAFRRYQLREGDAANTAWVWEHQALTRARYSAGDARIGAAFEAIRVQVLTTPRDAAVLAKEIVEMREKVLAGHPNTTELFDLKHDRGGMVDIEFVVQYWVLLHAAQQPEMIRNTGNIALLREVSRFGLMSEAEAETVGAAYRTYRKLQHRLRLDGMEKARVEPERVAAERRAVVALWERAFGA
ncbi:bifunctional [glutamate--ammonia ligase]-adenylyl-L-tyrosine phosphorylase/[glutamate--ammonia-ligase] adenylyltransferase [Burkholderia thailandensis]|uniref:bifunctional [glutamate--ammonia ligase]-adenylyl-L-tyrosine phosphorylase/[glutamate--ammonia-ligase] adenylyltransferase n=1 Tax=Burkholderia thailandensis TaxID=57975 RepID=UPI0022AC55A8|nr:bifunctional [glutamate--ammonia ligase]-adenylyl-L-tyrosine phosphorylase/[glutamate--ammonia-ligase] adenylyltransferase [Burkholderia thailandensis]MCZ2898314.1 bifunctional [glutamate--ammonia ligase]-adenylyl-L-tyrosine phosphorylase/[glutamate--ammonia-ligase] adenylyltransferase [Burkholderia thailandensis]MDD1478998.1 bifunctional [glutamate--ammonia ligase]-adenylyl-L-tyrosine phosphorylase/[glutamate--ammonia-ligase] adenylyltransferase [Burkholderia thailandensis]MDD1485965.1 bifun